jgi:tetratricopeptide (TPR) repeat protein
VKADQIAIAVCSHCPSTEVGPVAARPASVAYRTAKFIKRNKISLAVTSVFALVVLAGAIATVREAQIARMQEARAERRFESLRKLTNSLLFEFHDSIENLPGSTNAELVVRRALEYLEQIEAEARDDPATLRDLAAAYERIGRIRAEEGHPHLGGTGSFQQANDLYEKALAIRQKLAAANPSDASLQLELLGTMLNVARIDEQFGELDRALALQQQRLEIEEELAKSHDSEDLRYNIAASLIGIGELKLWLGEYESALDYERRSLTGNRRYWMQIRTASGCCAAYGDRTAGPPWFFAMTESSPKARPSLEKHLPSLNNSQLATRITLSFSVFSLPITRACVSASPMPALFPKCQSFARRQFRSTRPW